MPSCSKMCDTRKGTSEESPTAQHLHKPSKEHRFVGSQELLRYQCSLYCSLNNYLQRDVQIGIGIFGDDNGLPETGVNYRGSETAFDPKHRVQLVQMYMRCAEERHTEQKK